MKSHAQASEAAYVILFLCVTFLLAGCAHYQPKPLAPAETESGLNARTLADAGLQAFIETNAPELAKEWPRSTWDLAGLTLATLYYHPSLDVARAQWQASQASVITAGARPNPSISATPEYTVNPASGLTPWIATIQFDLPIETAGKRRHRIARAEQLTRAAWLQLASSAWRDCDHFCVMFRGIARFAFLQIKPVTLAKRAEQ